MNIGITKENGELDAEKLVERVKSLNLQLGALQNDAEVVDLMPTQTESGVWIFKRNILNPEKIELLGKNAYLQSLVLAELYEIQMQAMQLSMGSFDALKTVNKELTNAIEKGFAESGEQNQQLFKKTQEQILRIAKFAKNNADNFEELKNELRNEFEESLSQFVKLDDVGKQIENSLQNYVNNKELIKIQNDIQNNINNEITNVKNQLSEFVGVEDVKKQIKDEVKKYTTKEDFDDFQNCIEQNLQKKLDKTENDKTVKHINKQISDFKVKLKEYLLINQVEEKINYQISEERKNISELIEEKQGITESLVKDLDDRIKKIEIWINSKQKINGQIICGIVLGVIGTILSLLSIFLL